MLPQEEVSAILRGFKRTTFRLETLDVYTVDSDAGNVERYLQGGEQNLEVKGPWLETLRSEKAAGKLRHRVHILRTPLSDYLRYECEWGYLPNAEAGEEIHILDLAETALPDGVVMTDFWLVDDETVVIMRYDDEGRYLGGELADDVKPYRHTRDVTLAAAEDVRTWWARHPEFWRATQARV